MSEQDEFNNNAAVESCIGNPAVPGGGSISQEPEPDWQRYQRRPAKKPEEADASREEI